MIVRLTDTYHSLRLAVAGERRDGNKSQADGGGRDGPGIPVAIQSARPSCTQSSTNGPASGADAKAQGMPWKGAATGTGGNVVRVKIDEEKVSEVMPRFLEAFAAGET